MSARPSYSMSKVRDGVTLTTWSQQAHEVMFMNRKEMIGHHPLIIETFKKQSTVLLMNRVLKGRMFVLLSSEFNE